MRSGKTHDEWTALLTHFAQRPVTLAKYAPVSALVAQEQHMANFLQVDRHIAYFDQDGEPALLTLSPERKR